MRRGDADNHVPTRRRVVRAEPDPTGVADAADPDERGAPSAEGGAAMPLVETLGRLRPARRLPAWACYAAAAGLVLAAYLLRLALEGVYHYPFATFVPAIVVAALLFGHGSGLLAAVLATALAPHFFAASGDDAGIGGPDAMLALGAFLILSLLVAAALEALAMAVERLAEVNAWLTEANRRLAGAEQAARDAARSAREADARRRVLLDDVNHRLKNSLQAITAILLAEGRSVDDPSAKAALEGAAGRLRVLARVHERLHLKGADPDAAASLVGGGRLPPRAVRRPPRHAGRRRTTDRAADSTGAGRPAGRAGGVAGPDRERGGRQRAQARVPGRARRRGGGAAAPSRGGGDGRRRLRLEVADDGVGAPTTRTPARATAALSGAARATAGGSSARWRCNWAAGPSGMGHRVPRSSSCSRKLGRRPMAIRRIRSAEALPGSATVWGRGAAAAACGWEGDVRGRTRTAPDALGVVDPSRTASLGLDGVALIDGSRPLTSPHRVVRAEFQWSMAVGGCADPVGPGRRGGSGPPMATSGAGGR
jgi:hypothetical protein